MTRPDRLLAKAGGTIAARGKASRRAFLGASGAALSVGFLQPVAHAALPTGDETTRADVAVVGAGLAGLATARALGAAGLDVVVLEARDRIGGRVLDVDVGGATVPLGAAWVHPAQRRALALAAEAGATVRAVPDRRARAVSPAVAPALRWLDAMAEGVDSSAPWHGPGAARRDTASLAAWIADQVLDPAAAAELSALVERVWGVPAQEVSVLQVLADVAAAGGTAPLVELAATPPLYVGGGIGALAAHLARPLGDRLRLGAPVARIDHGDTGALLTGPGFSLRAERVVVAVPVAAAQALALDPAVTGRRLLGQRLPMGSVATVAALYDRRPRRGDEAAPVPGGPLGPVQVVPAGGGWLARAELTGAAARRWSALPADERRALVLDALTGALGPGAARPREYIEHDWQADPWSGGGWSHAAPPGVLSGFGAALREPAGPIHVAGAETATVWTGRIEGALESAERAAAEVVAALGRRDRAAESRPA